MIRGLARVSLPALLVSLLSCGARTGLGDEPYSSTALYCTANAFTGHPARALSLVVGVPRALRDRARWTVVSAPAGAAPTLQPEGDRATFLGDREGDYTVRVTLPPDAVDGGDAGADTSCDLAVRLRYSGPVATCPTDVTVAPLETVTLTARIASDRPLSRVGWTVDAAPASSARRPPTPDDNVTTQFTPDVAGDHRLRFRAVDNNGASDECVTTVHAVPREGLRVELSWDPPGRSCPDSEGAACDESDVDLHLLDGVGTPVWGVGDNRTESDCYYLNCTNGAQLRWGAATADDDPHLDIDDQRGHGPENINILRPSAPYYRIGVHYFTRHDAGPEAATVTVYCNGATPVARLGPVTIVGRASPAAGDLWIVADVIPLAGGGCRVAPISRGGQPWVSSLAEAASGVGPPAP